MLSNYTQLLVPNYLLLLSMKNKSNDSQKINSRIEHSGGSSSLDHITPLPSGTIALNAQTQNADTSQQIRKYLIQAIEALDSGDNTEAIQQLQLATDRMGTFTEMSDQSIDGQENNDGDGDDRGKKSEEGSGEDADESGDKDENDEDQDTNNSSLHPDDFPISFCSTRIGGYLQTFFINEGYQLIADIPTSSNFQQINWYYI